MAAKNDKVLKRGYSIEQLNDFREVFNLFDKDKDGRLSVEELTKVFKTLGVVTTGDEKIKQMIEHVDTDKSGAVEFEEFLNVMQQQPKTPRDDARLLAAFKIYDKNADGYITKQELQSVMEQCGEKLTDKEAQTMIDQADTDKDGRVNYREFINMMKD